MKFLKFSLISLIGLCTSSILFFLSQSLLNLNSYYSNLIGDGVVLILVYLYSWYFIFDHSRNNFKRKFLLNLIARIFVIYFLSISLWLYEQNLLYETYILLDRKITTELLITIIKIIVAPISLIMNYILSVIIIEVYLKKNL